MRRLIVFVGLLAVLEVKAEIVEHALVKDYLPVSGRDFAYELKTQKFDNVILDCGGFAGWMTFRRAGKIVHNVYLDTYSDCPNMHTFLNESKENKLPVCLQVTGPADKSSLTVSNEEDDCL